MSTDQAGVEIVVVGGGLAGLSTAISAVDAGATNVVLLEKEPRTGGNSAKATSGINGCCTEVQAANNVTDSISAFSTDTFRSGDHNGAVCDKTLVNILCTDSASAVDWLMTKFNIPLTVLTQLGGHSVKRSHRCPPDDKGRPVPVGFFITKTLLDAITSDSTDKNSKYKDAIHIINNARLTKINRNEDDTLTCLYTNTLDNSMVGIKSKSVVLCCGGFGFDRSPEGMMAKYRPDLLGYATTNGPWTVGDGMKVAEALGANLIDMDKVQLHPTAFIDPKNPDNKVKFLAPEALRGSGGILVDSTGKRFVDELQLRNVVSKAIIESKEGFCYCVLNKESQELFGKSTLGFYQGKLGLLQSAKNVTELADLIKCEESVLSNTLREYENFCEKAACEQTGKTIFPVKMCLSDADFIVARVTPAVHYCMGGVQINKDCAVISKSGEIIKGLFACGEVTGGVHGDNRLGGNSLLECVVFGRIAGERAAARSATL